MIYHFGVYMYMSLYVFLPLLIIITISNVIYSICYNNYSWFDRYLFQFGSISLFDIILISIFRFIFDNVIQKWIQTLIFSFRQMLCKFLINSTLPKFMNIKHLDSHEYKIKPKHFLSEFPNTESIKTSSCSERALTSSLTSGRCGRDPGHDQHPRPLALHLGHGREDNLHSGPRRFVLSVW